MKRNGHEYITASLAGHPRVDRKIGGMRKIDFECNKFFKERGMPLSEGLSPIKKPKTPTK